jgi:UDP-N-acetyl-D-glucosamine dehydrogenase
VTEQHRTHDLVVVGLGYVGLPLAIRAQQAGLRTAGYDISTAVVTGLNQGRSHVSDVSDGHVQALRSRGFTATTDPHVIGSADTVVICVPTGLTPDRQPDIGAVRKAAATVAGQLRPGMMVVLESTVYPGVTQDIVLPILSDGSGLTVGEDFYLGYSPERVDPGNHLYGIANTPKVVSGHTTLCAKYCATFYGRFVDSVVVAGGVREAELAKLLENSYRLVNIALVNEVAMYCDLVGVDVWDVLRCAGTKPFGFVPFTPGPGAGGHCIPVDPLYLADKAARDGFVFRTVDAACAVNDGMPGFVVRRAVAALTRQDIPVAGAEVLLLGVTYKPDVADIRESPAVAVAEGLSAAGARVRYHDPHVPTWTVGGATLDTESDVYRAAARADLTVLLQDHACYDLDLLGNLAGAMLDTRGKSTGTDVELL